MSEEELRHQFSQDPGGKAFPELAKILLSQSKNEEAMMVCLKGLSHVPENTLGRLLLARAFFELGFVPFAQRELQLVSTLAPDNEQVKNIVRYIVSPTESATKERSNSEPNVLAEAEFDIDDL